MNAIASAIYAAQQGVRRLAADGVNIQIEVEQILVAFENRQPDAMERAERLRDRLVTEATGLLNKIDMQQEAISQGVEGHFDKRPELDGFGYTNLHTATDRGIARATALSAAASHVSDLIEIFSKLRLRDGDLRDEKGLPAPGPTTETLYHLRHMKGGDPILRLRATEKLTDDHVRSAREIEAVQRWVTSGMGMKVQRLPVKIDADEDQGAARHRTPAEHQEHMALLHAMVFVPWSHGTNRDRLTLRIKTKEGPSEGENIAANGAMMVLELVGGDSLKVVAGRWRMRSAKALSRVQASLDRYAKLRGAFSRVSSTETVSDRSYSRRGPSSN